MQSSVEEVSSVQKRVKVELKADSVNTAFLEAYKELQKKANIRGFRPGKAPMNMVKKMYGESVAADVADKLIKKHLFDAIENQSLRPISSPSLEDLKLPKQDETYQFSALIDVMPDLKLPPCTGIAVSATKYEVKPEDINKELEGLRKNQAKRKTLPEETVAKEGMVATIRHSATVNGEPFAPLSADKIPVELGAEQTLPEFEKEILGMKAGEDKTFSFDLPKEFPDPEKAGKPAQIQLHVEQLEELVLPALDDEFAKDLGAESLEKIKENIEAHFNMSYEKARRSELEKGLLDHILEKAPFEVPPTMVASVIDDMIEQMKWPDEQEKNKAKNDPEFRKGFVEQAKRKAQNTLVLWEIAKQEKIEVSDADIDAHLEKTILRGQEPKSEEERQIVAKMREAMGQGLKDNLLFEKALNFLIDNAKIKDMKPKV